MKQSWNDETVFEDSWSNSHFRLSFELLGTSHLVFFLASGPSCGSLWIITGVCKGSVLFVSKP
ncbi:hypothetical protein Mp_1g16720 [Marchantia polymorpha subsp. ruderalis]|uniref:Uncharacterized protein n=2 Tax=Marchantia polymorpha TaxID=3197 RepID=A0AAF6AQY1_MARPO|nr:hypothetical protein MARPO_0001s0013 [Marchantia polymorpha]BBM98851.1 hypothetical protein Mp_1g16720 [Marchantia polymorpha subsp. ruderalis]|eukprot:PTQ49927.1 hypothetical protein MARPO_0001s0013 [Marchantia polymorpha]